ncbi:hypothetical protein [Sulfurimonas sp.]|jgi:hypothetical protein|uniref:hypothetical protein n=1 Tax=Sulfurimonas sp. TaxID=2022749 RepID=UPI0025E426DD|nr:hypothetical protein [Sulfurimonas sp.]MCK9474054.1 hypothetical protein [Sulfurimonas sp.]
MKNIFLAIFFLLFLGCDGKIYKNIYDKSKIGVSVSSVEIIANDEHSLAFSKKVMEKKGFVLGKSNYKLRVEHRDYTKSCTNPLSKTSSDYSYEGLLVIEFFYEDRKIYSIYRDFKGKVNEKLFTTLIDIMIDDLEIR